jgi:sulfoxide reductase catalytic subunit YedY
MSSLAKLKQSYGKQLKRIHAWNAWTVLALAITGLLLYAPFLRGDVMGLSIRGPIKWLHIGLGVGSTLILIYYLIWISRHFKQLSSKWKQKINLIVVLVLIAGWIISGFILWFERDFPRWAAYYALLLHDLFTWLGIPWLIYHSITRSRLFKTLPQSIPHTPDRTVIPRRQFLRYGIGALLLALIGPFLFRWLYSVLFSEQSLTQYVLNNKNRMSPSPVPLPDSKPPIGGGVDGEFRIYTVTDIPVFNSNDWEFTITGLVEQPLRYNWEQFLKLPRFVQDSHFHCVTGWSVFHCTWEGVRLKDLLEQAGIKSNAKFVKFHSGDGVYTDSLSMEQAFMDDVMVAVMLDGHPLPQQLGGPVRLIAPKMYAYKSVKWLQTIELMEELELGYWEVRGYDNDAWATGKPAWLKS